MTPIFEKVELPFLKIPYQDWISLPESVLYRFDMYEPKAMYQLALIKSHTLTLNRVRLACVNGKLIKLDGGSIRRFIEESKKISEPAFVFADIYEMDDKAYQALCRKILAVTRSEVVVGNIVQLAYEKLDIVFNSRRLSEGRIKEAFDLALRGIHKISNSRRKHLKINVVNAVAAFRDELCALDSLDIKAELFKTGVLGAALIMLTIDPDNIAFFRAYNDEKGSESEDGVVDPVGALLKYVAYYNDLPSVSQMLLISHLCQCTVNAVVSWRAEPGSVKYLKRGEICPRDHMPYVKQVVRKKADYGIFDEEDRVDCLPDLVE